MNGKFRWIILTGNSTAEGGANAGSDFQINRYNDAGAYIGAALIINRKTSDATLSGGLTVAGWGTFGGVDHLCGSRDHRKTTARHQSQKQPLRRAPVLPQPGGSNGR